MWCITITKDGRTLRTGNERVGGKKGSVMTCYLLFLSTGREKKREVKQAIKTDKQDTLSTIQKVLDQVAQDEYPTLTEEKEAYFMNQVSQGESLVAKGKPRTVFHWIGNMLTFSVCFVFLAHMLCFTLH